MVSSGAEGVEMGKAVGRQCSICAYICFDRRTKGSNHAHIHRTTAQQARMSPCDCTSVATCNIRMGEFAT